VTPRDHPRIRLAGARRAGFGIPVGPGRDAGALLTLQEERGPAGPRTAELRLGEPARFPLSLLAPHGRRPDTTGIDLYIELI
jgi:hypothetical protein